jgi:hypothetical protein
VQLAAGVNVPVELVVKLTEPVGVLTVPSEESMTVAVHDVGWFTLTAVGLQLTLVEVVRRVPVTDPLVAPLLVEAA